jgi:hypothetical protein
MAAIRSEHEFPVYRPEWAATLRLLGHPYRILCRLRDGDPIWLFKKGSAEQDLIALKARFAELQQATGEARERFEQEKQEAAR